MNNKVIATGKYTYRKPFTREIHQWSIRGLRMAVAFHASIGQNEGDVSCGLEFHYYDRPAWDEGPPSDLDCEYTGGRCWHDGTSTYAMDNLWPDIEEWLLEANHVAIFRMLEQEMNRQMSKEEEK